MKKKNPHAVALGKLGGEQRARTLSAAERQQIALKAAKARNKKLSASERKRVAMLGVQARQRKREQKGTE